MHGFKRPVMPRTGVRPLLFSTNGLQEKPASHRKQHEATFLYHISFLFFPGSFNLLGDIFGNDARALLAFRLLAPQDPQFGVAVILPFFPFE